MKRELVFRSPTMLRRESSSTVIGAAGWDLEGADSAASTISAELQSEMQLMCAIYDDGRLKIGSHNSSAAGAAEDDDLFNFELTLFPHSAEIPAEEWDHEGVAGAIVLCLICPKFYLMDDVAPTSGDNDTTKSTSEDDNKSVRVAVEWKVKEGVDRTEAQTNFLLKLAVTLKLQAEEAAASSAPALMTLATNAQQAVDDAAAAGFSSEDEDDEEEEQQQSEESGHQQQKSSSIGEEQQHSIHEDPMNLDAYMQARFALGNRETGAAVDLPYDCWLVICSFLGPADSARAGASSSWMYDLVSDEPIWENFYLNFRPEIANIMLVPSNSGRLIKLPTANDDPDRIDGNDKFPMALSIEREDEKSLPRTKKGLDDRHFPWSWAASYRYLALKNVTAFMEAMKFRSIDNSATWEAPEYEASDEELRLRVLDKKRDLVTKYASAPHALGGFLHDSNLARSIRSVLVGEQEIALETLEAREWNDFYHRTGNADVKRVSHFKANFLAGNFNIALALLKNADYTKLSTKKKKKLSFPSTEAEFEALLSTVRVKSLDSDVENETDVTAHTIVRVKHRDYHSDPQMATSILRNGRKYRWSTEQRRWITVVDDGAPSEACPSGNNKNGTFQAPVMHRAGATWRPELNKDVEARRALGVAQRAVGKGVYVSHRKMQKMEQRAKDGGADK